MLASELRLPFGPQGGGSGHEPNGVMAQHGEGAPDVESPHADRAHLPPPPWAALEGRFTVVIMAINVHSHFGFEKRHYLPSCMVAEPWPRSTV